MRGVAQSGVRVANERAVLTLIAGIPGVSNADIARRSGLGPQTTARILSDLEERDLIIRGAVLRGRRGQPATPYRLNPQGGYAFGVEIGWNHIEVLLQDIAGQPLAAVRRAYAFADPARVFGQVGAEIATLLSGLTPRQRERLVGISVTTPGAFGPLLQRLGADQSIIAAWADIDIAARITQETGLPAIWVNDGNAAAWCEITMHPPPRPAGLASFFIGTFVGGGVVARGQLLEGPHGNAADLGAIIVNDGKGQAQYLHLIASLDALSRRLAEAGYDPGVEAPRYWNWQALEGHVDPWIDEAGYALAQAILSTAALSEIDVAIINGDVPAGFIARIVARTGHHLEALPRLVPVLPRLIPGRAGPSAPVLGAARLLLFRQHFSRAWDIFHAEIDE